MTEVVQDLQSRALAGMSSFDRQLEPWLEGHLRKGGRIYCARGCRNCCDLAVHCSFPEALAAASGLSPDLAAPLDAHVEDLLEIFPGPIKLREYLRRQRLEAKACPFLSREGSCGIYPLRPLACRALLSTRNSEWCAVSLAELHPLEREAFLSSLDPEVVAFPTHYAALPKELAREEEGELSMAMGESCGFSISGNLPFLVWLERRLVLSRRLAEGYQATLELLREEGLDRPFLVRITPFSPP